MGRVRSKDKIVNGKYGNRVKRKGVILKLSQGTKYLHVGLYNSTGQKSKTHTVHSLVATAFCDKPEYESQVMHLNDIKTDNRACNLKWGTNVENMRSAWANGLVKLPFAWQRTNSKYGADIYRNIFTLYNTGLYNPHQIAEMCSYPTYCIYNILRTYRKYFDEINLILNIPNDSNSQK